MAPGERLVIVIEPSALSGTSARFEVTTPAMKLTVDETGTELASLGYKAVIYPLTAFRAAMRAAEQVRVKVHRDTDPAVAETGADDLSWRPLFQQN